MKAHRKLCSALLVAGLLAPPLALGQYMVSVTNLHPADTTASVAEAVTESKQAGEVYLGLQGILLPTHAAIWSSAATTWVDLNPPGASSSRILAMAGNQQGGEANFTSNIFSGPIHAVLWFGNSNSWIDLNPPGAINSTILAVSASAQGGAADFGSNAHAGIWSGSATSWMDLHPAGAVASYVESIADSQQAGVILTDHGFRGGIWSGTASSWVDLTPVGWDESYVISTTGARQGGFIHRAGGIRHATLWSGTAESFVDLHPSSAFISTIQGLSDSVQVGFASFVYPDSARPYRSHAGVWSGTPESWFDLHRFLDTSAIESQARAIWMNGDKICVVGDFFGTDLISKAVLWVLTPSSIEPVANADGLSRKSGQAVKVKSSTLTTNDIDPDSQLLTVASVSSPSTQGGTVTLTEGWVYYQPPSGSDPPLDSFTYVVSDPSGNTATGTVTVSVAPPSTDPTLNILSVTGGFPNPAIIRFAGIPGREYTVESSPVINPAVWKSIGTVTVGRNGIAEFTDNEAATSPTLFYRVLQP